MDPDAETREIRCLVARLGRRSRVRPLALNLLRGEQPDIAGIDRLFFALRNPSESRWRERAVAAWALGQAQLSSDDRDHAVSLLCDVLANKQMGMGKRWLLRLGRAGTRVLLPALIATGIGHYAVDLYNLDAGNRGILDPWRDYPHANEAVFMMLLFVLFYIACLAIPLFSIGSDARRTACVRGHTATALGRLRAPESIAALAGAISDLNVDLNAKVLAALRNTLPILSSEHYGRLNAQTTPNLCRLLASWHISGNAALEVLEALGKIGDGRAVEPVERFAREQGHKFREAAERILSILRERQRQENDPHRLLRAASAPDAPADVLLRPAQGGSRPDPQVLLRANTSGNDPTDRAEGAKR